jgi:hypothetical protein
MVYFAPGAFRGDWFGPWRYRRLVSRLNDGDAAVAAELRAIGADYLLINRQRAIPPVAAAWPRWTTLCPVFVRAEVVVFGLPASEACASEIATPLPPSFSP